jgi:hypothetical protein
MSIQEPWYESQLIGFIVGSLLAFFSPLFVNWIWSRYLRPNLVIEDIVVRGFHLKDANNDRVTYYSNRVRIANNGRTAARECKAFLLINESMERVAWMIPYRNDGYTNNLNAFDSEYLDVCAINDDGSKIIATTEHGYEDKEDSARHLDRKTKDMKLRISAANAKPTEAYVHFIENKDHKILELHRIQKDPWLSRVKRLRPKSFK